MALNEIFRDADHLSLPVKANTKAGDPVRVGGLNGVCQTDRVTAEGDQSSGNPVGNATVWLKGGHEFEVAFAVADVGDPVYISSAGKLSATDTDDLFGHALTTKAATAGPLVVRISN